MARQLVHDNAAANDLVEIWIYTYKQWGRDQAEIYLHKLERLIEELREQPTRGKQRDTIRAGYWSIRTERHIVFYTFDDREIRIRRVLHERMDIGQHL